jgi:hypothetical protein
MFFQVAQGFVHFSTGGVVEVPKPLSDLRGAVGYPLPASIGVTRYGVKHMSRSLRLAPVITRTARGVMGT